MDIRLGPVQADTTRYPDTTLKRGKRAKTNTPRDEETWSERSDYADIEDCYVPADKSDQSAE